MDTANIRRKLKLIFLTGLLTGIFLCPLGIFIYVKSGHMPVTTDDAPMPFEKFIARSAIHVAAEKEKNLQPRAPITDAQLKNGAHLFVNHCAGCHGLIDSPHSKMAAALYPPAPQLFKADDLVTDDPVGIIHWKIKNGIRLTGMPAFKTILSDDEMWEISAVLQQADKLSEPVKAELTLSVLRSRH